MLISVYVFFSLMSLRHAWSCNVMKSAATSVSRNEIFSQFLLSSIFSLRLISKLRNAVRPSFSPILSHSFFSQINADLYLETSLSLSLSFCLKVLGTWKDIFLSYALYALFPTPISLYQIICFTSAHFQRSPSRPSVSLMTRTLYLHSRDILALTSFTNPCHPEG